MCKRLRQHERLPGKRHFTVGIEDDVTEHVAAGRPARSPPRRRGRSSAASGGWGRTARSAPTRRPSRSSATTPTCTSRPISPTTPRSRAESPSRTCASARSPIQSTYLVDAADYIACHKAPYVQVYDVLEGIKEGGIFVLNSPWNTRRGDGGEPAGHHAAHASPQRRSDSTTSTRSRSPQQPDWAGRINMIMQTAFFKLSGVLPFEQAVALLKDSIRHEYGKKGEPHRRHEHRRGRSGGGRAWWRSATPNRGRRLPTAAASTSGWSRRCRTTCAR